MGKKKRRLIRFFLLSIIPTIGVLVALIYNSTELYDKFWPKKKKSGKTDCTIVSTDSMERSQLQKGSPPRNFEQLRRDSIEIIIREARAIRGASTHEARKLYLKAYELLPDTQKNEDFITSVKNSTISPDFETQANHLDSFFRSLNY
jgi:hypothetical protein